MANIDSGDIMGMQITVAKEFPKEQKLWNSIVQTIAYEQMKGVENGSLKPDKAKVYNLMTGKAAGRVA